MKYTEVSCMPVKDLEVMFFELILKSTVVSLSRFINVEMSVCGWLLVSPGLNHDSAQNVLYM